MKQKYVNAISATIVEEMQRDERVIWMGQDVRSGLYGEYPPELEPRIRNVPISEAANVGATIGSALTGLRPVLDMTFATFLYSCTDQVINQAAKLRYMFGGQTEVPLVIRSTLYYGSSIAAHHADRPYPMFMNVPGLKIAVPSTPTDVKGLLRTAIREPDPVLFFEDVTLHGTREEVPDDPDFLIPFGAADVKREGEDVTVVGIAGGVRLATQAAKKLEAEGISAEVIDPRTLVPLDWETICASVEKTGRLVIVDPAVRTCSAASEIAATVTERCFASLRLPPVRITAPDTQTPFSPPLEKSVLPNRDDVIAAVRGVVEKSGSLTSARS